MSQSVPPVDFSFSSSSSSSSHHFQMSTLSLSLPASFTSPFIIDTTFILILQTAYFLLSRRFLTSAIPTLREMSANPETLVPGEDGIVGLSVGANGAGNSRGGGTAGEADRDRSGSVTPLEMDSTRTSFDFDGAGGQIGLGIGGEGGRALINASGGTSDVESMAGGTGRGKGRGFGRGNGGDGYDSDDSTMTGYSENPMGGRGGASASLEFGEGGLGGIMNSDNEDDDKDSMYDNAQGSDIPLLPLHAQNHHLTNPPITIAVASPSSPHARRGSRGTFFRRESDGPPPPHATTSNPAAPTSGSSTGHMAQLSSGSSSSRSSPSLMFDVTMGTGVAERGGGQQSQSKRKETTSNSNPPSNFNTSASQSQPRLQPPQPRKILRLFQNRRQTQSTSHHLRSPSTSLESVKRIKATRGLGWLAKNLFSLCFSESLVLLSLVMFHSLGILHSR